MKKPDTLIDTASSKKKPDLKRALKTDDPIIHTDDPENSLDITFTDLPEKIPAETGDVTTAPYFKELKITSPAFRNNERIPVNYTCDGVNMNPPLEIDHIPEETKCLALIVDDPDASTVWVHWVVWNIPVTHHIRENEIHGIQGINDFHKNKYQGPCPPSETHHYFFKVYALNALLSLKANSRKPDLEKAMSKHIIGFGQLVGVYKRPD